jgi:hypothetical protein
MLFIYIYFTSALEFTVIYDDGIRRLEMCSLKEKYVITTMKYEKYSDRNNLNRKAR